MRRRLMFAAVLVLLVALPATAGAGSSRRATRGAFPGGNGKIVFVTLMDDGGSFDNEIMRIRSGGTGLVPLTDNSLADESPAWNASGDRIAWVQAGDVWIMRADGSHTRQVTHTNLSEYRVAWAPTGGRLVVMRDTGNYDLFVINLKGRTIQRLTKGMGDNDNPQWSPDGTLIAFTGDPGSNQIFTIHPDGTRLKQITDLAGPAYMGGWHPRSRKIVYSTFFETDYELFSMGRGGGNKTQLTANAWSDESPTYSPDGTSLVWIDNFDGDYEVVTSPATDTPSAIQLTFNTTSDSGPDWQPT